MATVRISDSIRHHVKQKILLMYAKRIDEALREAATVPGICNDIYTRAYSTEIRHHAAALPKNWLPHPETINVTVEWKEPDGSTYTQTLKISWRPPSPMPADWLYSGIWVLKPGDSSHAETVEKIKHYLSLNKERDDLVASLVDNLLCRCSTLRQVLEVWPQALEFMPDDVLSKHNAVVGKREKLDLSTIVVDDQTKANMLKARLLTP